MHRLGQVRGEGDLESEARISVRLGHHGLCDLGSRSAQVLEEVLGLKRTFSEAENRLLVWGMTTHPVCSPRP